MIIMNSYILIKDNDNDNDGENNAQNEDSKIHLKKIEFM